MKRILFLHNYKYEVLDGLWAALRLLEKDFEIIRHCVEDELPESDFCLAHGAFGSDVDRKAQTLTIPKGLCIGGITQPAGADNYDVLFYETRWYRPQIQWHKNIVRAFGVNTDIFSPIDIPTPVVWDYVGVGAFALWKRWELMKNKRGNRLVIGEVQKDNQEESVGIIADLVNNGVMVSNQINSFDLANIYHFSRTCYVPATVYGGGERTLWEAMSCGLKVEIEDDNPKLKELMEEGPKDHFYYAQQLRSGIMSCLKG